MYYRQKCEKENHATCRALKHVALQQSPRLRGCLNSLDWNGGMEWWNGGIDWNGGMEGWWVPAQCPWAFGLSRISGMEWWNGIVKWNTGMTFHPLNLTFGGAMSYSTS